MENPMPNCIPQEMKALLEDDRLPTVSVSMNSKDGAKYTIAERPDRGAAS